MLIIGMLPASVRGHVYGPLRLSHLVRLLRWVVADSSLSATSGASTSSSTTSSGRSTAVQAERMVRLLGWVFLIGHWLACLWYVVLTSTGELDPDEHALGTLYLMVLYKALLSIFAEDVDPGSDGARTLAIFSLFLGGVVTATLFANFADLVSLRNAQISRHRESLDNVNQTMAMVAVPAGLRRRVLQYFDSVWLRHRDFSGFLFLQRLPETLQMEVSSFVHTKVIKRVPAFKGCKAIFIDYLARKLRPSVFLAGSMIFAKGTMGRSMYFIEKGTVAIHDDASSANLLYNMLNRGDFFGEIAVLPLPPRIASATALTCCDFFELF